MWVLATDGDIFEGKSPTRYASEQLTLTGKKLWLRPGKKFLFGRTAVESMSTSPISVTLANGTVGGIIISDKTISRKHLTIEVDQVGLEDCVSTPGRITYTV